MKRQRAVTSFFWAYSASKVAQGTITHPLCKILEGNNRIQLAELPAVFICQGGDGGATTCSPMEMEPQRLPLAGAPTIASTSGKETPAGKSAGHAAVPWIADSDAVSTWLVCEGARNRATGMATETRSWVDCRGYFAVYGISDNPSKSCRNLKRRTPHENIHSMDFSILESEEVVPAEIRSTENMFVVDQSAQAELEIPRFVNDQAPKTARKMAEQDQGYGIVEGANENEQVVDVERRSDLFVSNADDRCDAMWTSWPAVHETAIDRGTFLVFKLFPSIGNLFNTLNDVLKIARLLEVAVILDWQGFEGFRVAFDPAEITWDLDPSEIVQRAQQFASGSEPANHHSLKFHDGFMILSDSQLEMLAHGAGIVEPGLAETAIAIEDLFSAGLRLLLKRVGRPLAAPQPCAWNMLLRRSPSMMMSMAEHSGWMQPADSSGLAFRRKDYVAWHIRTSVGETERSFDPAVHKHVFHKKPSSMVCSLYFSATDEAKETCRGLFPSGVGNLPIYVSSNSQSMSRNCTSDAANLDVRAGFVDMGLADSDAHTKFSKNPTTTAVKALMDYLFLMDAAMIVRTKSTFSGTVAKIKGLQCSDSSAADALDVSGLKLCMPEGC
ncbi:unnamed protein product [Scytosiphon promiscuus]